MLDTRPRTKPSAARLPRQPLLSLIVPVLNEGDLVFIEGVKRADIKTGDIVVWRNPQGFTIHRVVRLDTDTLVTKGDANFTEDKPVAYSDVVGRTAKVFGSNARLPYFGMVTVYASKR